MYNVLLQTLAGDEAASLMDDLLVVSSSRSSSYGFQFPFSLLRARYSLRSHRILPFFQLVHFLVLANDAATSF